jgi:hypothetical protein
MSSISCVALLLRLKSHMPMNPAQHLLHQQTHAHAAVVLPPARHMLTSSVALFELL